MELNKWLPLSWLDFTQQYDMYVCDTRDFRVSAWEREDSSYDTIDEYIKGWVKNNVYDKCTIEPTDIPPLLKEIGRLNMERSYLKLSKKILKDGSSIFALKRYVNLNILSIQQQDQCFILLIGEILLTMLKYLKLKIFK